MQKKNIKFDRENFILGIHQLGSLLRGISMQVMKPDPNRLKAITDMLPPKSKEGIVGIPWHIKLFDQFFPFTTEVRKPSR